MGDFLTVFVWIITMKEASTVFLRITLRKTYYSDTPKHGRLEGYSRGSFSGERVLSIRPPQEPTAKKMTFPEQKFIKFIKIWQFRQNGK